MPAESAQFPTPRTARLAWSAVIVILVGVITLLVYALTDTPITFRLVHRVVTPPAVLNSLAGVPASIFNSVGVTAPATGLTPPAVFTGQPPLHEHGKPEVLYVGAEYCPFCAAERWPLVLALSRFGTFRALDDMTSSANSVFPSLSTFSFFHSSYASPYVAFNGIEVYSDIAGANGVFTQISILTPGERALLDRYGSASHTVLCGPTGSGSYPLVDVGNSVIAATSGFSPATIVGHSQSSIVDSLYNRRSTVGRAIVASANYLTAGICSVTGWQPSSVCTSKGVRAAAQALGIR
ncbi:MAG: DUF929 family protein [Acidimicrobiales bacterium]